ncbi:MAG: YicC family protein [Flavobacteriaceae bacterium TMED42]|nr:MAG: YicC family protein [Flavobacteriaceae bacterium TMED42]|tara:strand:+ start:677 stop:1534 length:858 start_codon:yes stop_codon:yes gene_type:complete
MIQSMTGFGKAEIQFENKNYVLELRSLNSKGLELNARLPVHVREIEIQLKKSIGETLKRGKIDLNLNIENISESIAKTINVATVNQYIDQLKSIEDGDRLELLKIALKLPDTLKTEIKDFDESEIELIESLLKKAIDDLNGFRSDEGKILEIEFNKRLDNLEGLLKEVEMIDPERSSKIKEKLNSALEALPAEVDQNRFEQELIYYLEKYDITEEKVRLKNHFDYFKKTLDSETSNGKKLGFISQEIGREINTIGSKANHAGLQKLVIQMKDELEKIKEQLLNVL